MSEQSTLNYFVHEQKKRKCVFWMKKYKENVQENCLENKNQPHLKIPVR